MKMRVLRNSQYRNRDSPVTLGWLASSVSTQILILLQGQAEVVRLRQDIPKWFSKEWHEASCCYLLCHHMV